MRKFTAYFSIALFAFSFFFVAPSFAQELRNTAGTKYGDLAYIYKEDTFIYQLIGLQRGQHYRLELGNFGTSDAYFQHNLAPGAPDLNGGDRQCYPAGTAHGMAAGEDNKRTEAAYESYSCTFDSSSGTYGMTGAIKVQALLDAAQNTGAVDAVLYLKSQESKKTIQTIHIELIPNKPTITFDPSSGAVTAGNKLYATVTNLLPDSSYSFNVDDANQQTTYHTATLTTGAVDAACVGLSTNGVDSFYGGSKDSAKTTCTTNADGSTTAFLWIDTSGYNCAGGTGKDTGKCSFDLKQNNKIIRTKQFTINTGAFKVVMDPSCIATNDCPDPSIAGDPKVPYNFYETTDVKITATNCSAGHITFKWWRGAQAVCSSNGCRPNESVDPDDTQDRDTIGTYSFTHNFGAEGQSELYSMIAYCGTQKQQIDFRVWGKGEEFLNVPSTIPADQDGWLLTVGGLDDKIGGVGDRYKTCYYINLYQIDAQGTETPYVGDGSVTCSEDTNDKKKEDAIVGENDGDWYPQADVPMKGLPAGNYKADLLLMIKGNTDGNDEVKASKDFCVGDGPDCVNEQTEFAKPPIPPCAQFDATTGACDLVNTAIGQIHINIADFIKNIFSILLSISGMIILLIVIRSGYMLMTSQGNAEKVKEAQDRLTSAVVGLLFLIFALIILQVIGVDILHIPGFS